MTYSKQLKLLVALHGREMPTAILLKRYRARLVLVKHASSPSILYRSRSFPLPLSPSQSPPHTMNPTNQKILEHLVNAYRSSADPSLPCQQMLRADVYHPTLCTFEPESATEHMLKVALDRDNGDGVDGDRSAAKRIGGSGGFSV
jgi:hypothetical protein